MTKLNKVEALDKRNELVEYGFTIVPEVMPESLVQQLGIWSDDILNRVTIDHKIRYQGSDIFIYTEHLWAEADKEVKSNHFPDSLAEKIIDLPRQKEVCGLIGLECLNPDEVVIILSKAGDGLPLYWHQDFMKWDSPEAATPWSTRVFLSYYLTDTVRQNG